MLTKQFRELNRQTQVIEDHKNMVNKYTPMEKSLLNIAKQLIEIKFQVEVDSIEFEDGSGSKFIVVTKSDPNSKKFVDLCWRD